MPEDVDDLTRAVARILKDAKNRSPYSLTSLGDASGLGRATVQRYLDGERSIRIPEFYALCRVLNLDPKTVLDDAESSL